MDTTPRNPGQDPYADGASEAAVPQEAAFGAAPTSPPPPAPVEEAPIFVIDSPTPGDHAAAGAAGDAGDGAAWGKAPTGGAAAAGSVASAGVAAGEGSVGGTSAPGAPAGPDSNTNANPSLTPHPHRFRAYPLGPPPVGPGAADGTEGTAAGTSGPADTTGSTAKRPSLKRRGVALAVAAALAAGLLGGIAGGWVGGEFADDSPSATYTATGSAPVQSVADMNATGIAAVAKAVLPSVVEISVTTRRTSSSGSGLVLSADGKILTNAHVVEGSDGGTITVKFTDGRTAEATVVGTDSASDLAVIKVDGVDDLNPATLGDSDSVAVGDSVVAIGSPEGLTNTVTSGIVSALNREVTVPSSDSGQGSGLPFGGTDESADQSDGTTYHAIQTDASINPGNSGGPLLDMNGRVIGINSAIYSPTSGALGGDAGSVGLGFAIPVNQVKALLGDLESGAKA
ncbi:S1C family serine protease [Streptodolium elevatio]